MKRAIAWFAENHVAANLLMFILVAGGIASLWSINQKTMPDINVEVVSIGVPYLGAAPEEVEQGVCIRIEEELQGIEGIERLTSSAAEGACGVTAEILSGYPIDRALSEIKNAVDGIDTFPVETEKPTVSHISFRRNALKLALSGDVSEKVLKVLGERVRERISALPGVTQVELANARDYEISVEVPEESLRRHGLSFDQVVRAVRRGSLDRPGGSIKAEGGEVLLRTVGQAYTGEEFGELVVHTHEDGTRLLLGEVANVVDGFVEDDRYARFDGEPAVLIQIYRVGEQRVLELVETVRGALPDIAAELPDGVDLTVWQSGAQALRDRLDILVSNGRTGFILVFVVLALFLRLRLAFWVSLGVPISILGALFLFPALAISIDVISLFAFILVLGLLVDDAIVVGENVHRHQEHHEEPLHAAITGTQEVSVPVIFGVLTTVAAFMPMVMAPGELGQIFGAIGVVVIVCLFFSLVESQLILPAHLAHARSREQRSLGRLREGGLAARVQQRWKRVQTAMSGSLERWAAERYRPALERAIEWRYSTLASAVVLLMLTFAVMAAGHLSFSFFPPVESDYVTARISMPQGTPVETTAAAVRELERAADRLAADLDREFAKFTERHGPVVQHVLASVGEQPSSGRRGPSEVAATTGSHVGEVQIELQGGDLRPLAAREVGRRWREATPAIPDVEELTFRSALFSAGDPIDIQLRSADVEQLRAAADTLKDRLAQYPGVFDISDSFRDGKEEVRLSILPAAETLGLSLDDLAAQVRQAFYGAEAQRIQRGRDDVRVMVRYPESQRRSLADLDELRIRTPDGAEVPFYAVARAETGRGYSTIKRSNRQRVINVTADLDETRANANRIMADLSRSTLPEIVADHPGLTYGLEGEQEEQQKTIGALGRDYLFALLLIYALLAVPLRSYGQPLIIMAVIPFGLVGAVAGHLIISLLREDGLGLLAGPPMSLSMMSMFGVVALSGVVVNSSLVLVHYINQRRADGHSVLDAVRRAGVARFRPIVLTSITTFAGLTPLLTEASVSAQFLIPMATSLAFGVAFATLISLFLVPSGYVILEDLKSLFHGRRRRRQPVKAVEIEPDRDQRGEREERDEAAPALAPAAPRM